MSYPIFPLFSIEDKKKMLGSPKRKRNYNISPQKNKDAVKYKRSRERAYKSKNKKEI